MRLSIHFLTNSSNYGRFRHGLLARLIKNSPDLAAEYEASTLIETLISLLSHSLSCDCDFWCTRSEPSPGLNLWSFLGVHFQRDIYVDPSLSFKALSHRLRLASDLKTDNQQRHCREVSSDHPTRSTATQSTYPFHHGQLLLS